MRYLGSIHRKRNDDFWAVKVFAVLLQRLVPSVIEKKKEIILFSKLKIQMGHMMFTAVLNIACIG